MQYLCTFNTLPHISFMNYFAPKGEWTHFRRQNGEYILYYLVDGAMYLREGEKEYSLKAGDVFLLQPGLVHEGTTVSYTHLDVYKRQPLSWRYGEKSIWPQEATCFSAASAM